MRVEKRKRTLRERAPRALCWALILGAVVLAVTLKATRAPGVIVIQSDGATSCPASSPFDYTCCIAGTEPGCDCQGAWLFDGNTPALLGVDQCDEATYQDGSDDMTALDAPTPSATKPANSPAGHYSLSFDGTDDGMSGEDSAGLFDNMEPSGDYTLVFWIYMADATPGSMATAINKSDSTNGYYALVDTDATLRYEHEGDNEISNATFSDATWAHVCVAWDNAGTPGQYIYINGVQDNTGAATSSLTATTIDLTFGQGQSTELACYLYEVAFFDVLLSSFECCEICRFGLEGDTTDRTCGSCDYTP